MTKSRKPRLHRSKNPFPAEIVVVEKDWEYDEMDRRVPKLIVKKNVKDPLPDSPEVRAIYRLVEIQNISSKLKVTTKIKKFDRKKHGCKS